MKKTDIQSFDDVKKLVDVFYNYVLEDRLLKPIFNEFMTHPVEEHKVNIYNFWAFVLLNHQAYGRNVMMPHLRLPINELHFLRWFYFFRRTVYENFEGPVALDSIKRAEIILFTMKSKLESKNKLGITN